MIEKIYGGRIRIRVCGICQEENKILLIKHQIKNGNELWMPPGGGMEVGETMQETLVREFKEETGLEIEVGDFYDWKEFIEMPLHALEFFFFVKIIGGTLALGADPESEFPCLEEVAWKAFEEIKTMPIHPILNNLIIK